MYYSLSFTFKLFSYCVFYVFTWINGVNIYFVSKFDKNVFGEKYEVANDTKEAEVRIEFMRTFN